ncbi:MAG: hydrogenase maturation nickel metallochaperone HypA [Candidatus Thorarchaeota archaeon]
MHECSFAQSVIDTVVSQAKNQNVKKIKEVVMSFGVFSSIHLDQFAFCFDLVKIENDLTRSTNLVIKRVPGELKCQTCGFEGEISEIPTSQQDLAPVYPCPSCSSFTTEILSGTETTVESIVV